MSSLHRYGADGLGVVGGSDEADRASAVGSQVTVATVPCGMVPGHDDEAALRRQVSQLQQALQNRGVIEQAKGMLMLRYDVDSDRAFAILRRFSQHCNVKLHTVADTLVHAVFRRDVTTTDDAALVRWLHEQLSMDESESAARTCGPTLVDESSSVGDGTSRSPAWADSWWPSTAPQS